MVLSHFHVEPILGYVRLSCGCAGVLTIVVHIIWVLLHSDVKFEGKIFENMLKMVQKLGQTLNLPDFRNFFCKIDFCFQIQYLSAATPKLYAQKFA